MENKGWGTPIGVFLLSFICIMCLVLTLEMFFGVHIVHEWNVQSIDDTEVKVCQVCGEIKKEDPPKHSHTWEVKKEGDEIIAYCSSCGEIAE